MSQEEISKLKKKIIWSLVGIYLPFAVFWSLLFRGAVIKGGYLETMHTWVYFLWFVFGGLLLLHRELKRSEVEGEYFIGKWFIKLFFGSLVLPFIMGLALFIPSIIWVKTLELLFLLSFLAPVSIVLLAKISGVLLSLVVFRVFEKKRTQFRQRFLQEHSPESSLPRFASPVLLYGVLIPLVGVVIAYTFFIIFDQRRHDVGIEFLSSRDAQLWRQWFLAFYFLTSLVLIIFSCVRNKISLCKSAVFSEGNRVFYWFCTVCSGIVLALFLPMTIFLSTWQDARIALISNVGSLFSGYGKDIEAKDLVSQGILLQSPVVFFPNMSAFDIAWINENQVLVRGAIYEKRYMETSPAEYFLVDIRDKSIRPLDFGKGAQVCFDGERIVKIQFNSERSRASGEKKFDVSFYSGPTLSSVEVRPYEELGGGLGSGKTFRSRFTCLDREIPDQLIGKSWGELRPQDGFLDFGSKETNNSSAVSKVSADGSENTVKGMPLLQDSQMGASFLKPVWIPFENEYFIGNLDDTKKGPEDVSKIGWVSSEGIARVEDISAGPWSKTTQNGRVFFPVKNGLLARADFLFGPELERVSLKDSSYGLYLIKPDGSSKKVVAAMTGGMDGVFGMGAVSPDGCHVAFGLTDENKTAYKEPLFKSAFTVINACSLE